MVRDLLVKRAAEACPFVLIYGASGYGKSSLMRAGVVPALTRPGGAGKTNAAWRRVLLQPAKGSGSLCEKLARELVREPSEKQQEQARLHSHWPLSGLPEICAIPLDQESSGRGCWDAPTLGESLHSAESLDSGIAVILEALADADGLLLLQIDQLEEVFSEEICPSERENFFRAIHGLVTSGRVWCLATMRSEFFPRIAEEPFLRTLVGRDGGYILSPPDLQSLNEIIRFPALASRLKFERATAPRMVGKVKSNAEFLNEQIFNDASVSRDALPLVEFCLTKLYEMAVESESAQDRNILTWDNYSAIGGLQGAIATVAVETFQKLSPESQEATEFIFGSLVALDAVRNAVTRRRADLTSLEGQAGASEFLEAFQSAKLLITDRDDRSRVVFLAHESLLSHWLVLADWIDAHRSDLAAHQRLVEQTKLWRENERHRRFLLTEGRLAEAERVAASSLFILSTEEREFLNASRRTSRRKLRFFQSAAAIFAVVALAAIALGYSAKKSQREAEHSRVTLLGDKVNSILQTEGAHEAIPYLASILRKEPGNRLAAQRLVSTLMHRNFPLPYTRELSHGSRIHSVDFHPHGKTVVSAACAEFDGRAVIWDVESGKMIHSLRHDVCVEDAVFSGDGKRVGTASRDGTARVWDAETGEPVSPPLEHGDDWVLRVWLNHTGSLAVTTANGRKSYLWEVDTGKRLMELDNGGKEETTILEASFAGNAPLLLLNYRYTDSALIDHDALTKVSTFRNEGIGILNRDTSRIAFSFPWSAKLQFWSIRENKRVETTFPPFSQNVFAKTYSPDGNSLIVLLEDGKFVRVDDEQSYTFGQKELKFGKAARNFVVTPDGLSVFAQFQATVSSRAVPVNTISGKAESETMWHGISGPHRSLALHPFRALVATSSSRSTERSVRLWDVRPGAAISLEKQEPYGIQRVATGRSGEFIATVSHNGHKLTVFRTVDLSVVSSARFPGDITAVDLNSEGKSIIVGFASGDILFGDFSRIDSLRKVATVSGRITELKIHPRNSGFAVARKFPGERDRRPTSSVFTFGNDQPSYEIRIGGDSRSRLQWHPSGEILAVPRHRGQPSTGPGQ